MAIRQDSDPYCTLWLGVLILASFIFNFIYLSILMPSSALILGSAFTLLGGLSVVMVFLLVGYFRPEKGKGKNLMMSLSVLGGFFFIVFTDRFVQALPSVGTTLYLSVWGLGGSILTAAGFSMMHTSEESYSPGIMDVHSLHYGPTPEPAPEPTSEPDAEEQTKAEESANVSVPATEEKSD
jgi:hypothetical protein